MRDATRDVSLGYQGLERLRRSCGSHRAAETSAHGRAPKSRPRHTECCRAGAKLQQNIGRASH